MVVGIRYLDKKFLNYFIGYTADIIFVNNLMICLMEKVLIGTMLNKFKAFILD
uniref:Uncharacterized protein n=1 Tax=Bartonella schoenbuchensis (strain DSM 13525 / NCTC 13165 / R1) TaxID=687861 RepID=E6YYB8_BARSR|nr:hypothetical protein B11C_20206 [Bartonella schoenbuchensis R1]